MNKIQKKLYKAYGKVAKVLGEEFEIYRSQAVNNPLQEENFIDVRKVSFSMDEGYNRTPGQGFNVWNCYVDGRLEELFDIQQFDLLKSQSTGEIWMIASAEPLLQIKAFRMEDQISVVRSGYTDSGSGFGPGDTEVADLIPCKIDDGTPSGGSLGYVPASQYGTDAKPVAVIWVSDARREIQIRDAVTDQNGQRYQVLNNESTPIGNKLIVKAYEAA